MKKLLITISFLISVSLFSQDITGVWKGNLNMGGESNLDLYFTVLSADSEYKASMSVPQQGLTDLPLDSILYDNSELILVNNALQMKYKGKYVDAGFLGEFTQDGLTFPLSLEKGEIPKLNRPQEPKPPFPYKEENVVFNNRKHKINLSGTLTIPNGKGPFPAIVLISGSGPQDRNEEIHGHKPFLVIADYLARNGIAVLRFDDRGVGESEGTTKGSTTEDISYDAEAAFNYLNKRREISKVGLCGHSEGGSIAFMVAARNSKISFVISLAGTAIPGAEVLLSQQRVIGMSNNTLRPVLDNIVKTNKEYFDIILNSEENDEALRQELLNKAGGDESIVSTLTDPWMYYLIRYDPLIDILRIMVPVLALNGSLDLQVIADMNLPRIEEAAQINGNPNFRVEYLQGLNHLFQHAKTGNPNEYGQIEETFSVEVLEMMKEWILEQ